MNENFRIKLGLLIDKKRDELGFTQEYLAQKAGTTKATISNIERGAHKILLEHFIAIAKVLNISLKDVENLQFDMKADSVPKSLKGILEEKDIFKKG